MKHFLLLLTILFSCLSVNSEIVTGGVEYNYEEKGSRSEEVNFEFIRNHLIDSSNLENLNYIYEGKIDLKDRIIADFSDGSYGITFKDDPLYSWFYSQNGRLINFTKKSGEKYPCKITKYSPNGTVVYIGKKLSETESLIYSKDGRLIAHWIGNNCYDNSNKLIMVRKYKI